MLTHNHMTHEVFFPQIVNDRIDEKYRDFYMGMSVV